MATYPTNISRTEILERGTLVDVLISPNTWQYEARKPRNTTGNPRRFWTISHHLLDYTDMMVIYDFWRARKGAWEAFDWTDTDTSQTVSVRFLDDRWVVNMDEVSKRFTINLQLIEVL